MHPLLSRSCSVFSKLHAAKHQRFFLFAHRLGNKTSLRSVKTSRVQCFHINFSHPRARISTMGPSISYFAVYIFFFALHPWGGFSCRLFSSRHSIRLLQATQFSEQTRKSAISVLRMRQTCECDIFVVSLQCN